LIDAVLEGASERGMQAEQVFLDELDIRPCLGCRSCKGKTEECSTRDDFNGLIGKVREARLVVIGSPIYMGQVTGQTKTFLDRLYSLRRADRTIRLDGTKKKGAMVVVCGSTDPSHPDATRRTLGVFFRYLNTPDVEEIVEQGLGGEGEVLTRPEAIARAREIGRALANQVLGERPEGD
jgi:multimeric flavodoxin WrbA